MFINVARQWSGIGVKFEVIEPKPPLFSNSHQVPTLIKNASPLAEALHGLLFMILFLPTALKVRDFTVVLACNNHIINLLPALLISKLKKKPCIVVVHHYDIINGHELSTSLFGILKIVRRMGYSFPYSLIKALATKTAIAITRKCEAAICVSRVFTELFPNAYLSSNGVNLNLIQCVRGGEKEYDACFVGRLDIKKGILDLLDVWKKLISVLPSAKLALIGYDQVNIVKLVRSYGLNSNVLYLGVVDDEKVIETVKKSRVFVTMSTAEGWGIAIAEALACGTPVVCCKIVTLYEQWKWCPHVFFAKSHDIKDAAEQIIKVLKLPSMPPLKVKECVEVLSWKQVALMDAQIIRKVAEESQLLENPSNVQVDHGRITPQRKVINSLDNCSGG